MKKSEIISKLLETIEYIESAEHQWDLHKANIESLERTNTNGDNNQKIVDIKYLSDIILGGLISAKIQYDDIVNSLEKFYQIN